jgi:hypothetical protein
MGPHTLDRITINPAIMNGQPCIRGMRLTALFVDEPFCPSTRSNGTRLKGKQRDSAS